jgi:lipoprotein-anchoring transpeptidase ErfK/SrfK
MAVGSRRHWAAAGMLIAIVAGLIVWHESAATPPRAQGQSSATVPGLIGRPAVARLSRAHAKTQPATTLLATVRFTAPRYAAPGVPAAGQVPATWWGVPSVLPVVAQKPGWVEVRLAQRPNGSTAWLPASDVRLSSTGYRIVINLTTMRLSLYEGAKELMTAPAGIGTADDPTPTGHYFVAFDEPPPDPNPGYGPFIMVTSAHSPAIADWEGSGDAVIGIHGPLGEDSQIGTAGARISHGCVRLHDQDLLRLRQVPPGTPIDITG